MTRTILAALLALAVPAAASADGWRPPPPPVAGRVVAPAPRFDERRDVRELRQLVARYDEAAARRDRRAMTWLERELLSALQEEIAEARAALPPGFRGAPGNGHAYGRGFDRREANQNWQELRQLTSLRDELTSLQGRFGWRAIERKRSVAQEVMRIAMADLPGRHRGNRVAWNDDHR